MSTQRRVHDALEIIDTTLTKNDPRLKERIELEFINARVAQLIYDARTKASLSQAQLAKRIGTSQPVIARLEDADYRGHSLSMLQRIATALGKSIELRLVPEVKRRRAA